MSTKFKTLLVCSVIGCCVYLIIQSVHMGHFSRLKNYMMEIQNDSPMQVTLLQENKNTLLQVTLGQDGAKVDSTKDRTYAESSVKPRRKTEATFNDKKGNVSQTQQEKKSVPGSKATTDTNPELGKVNQDCSTSGVGGIYSKPLKPGCKMQQITIAEAIDQYRVKTSSKCNNKCPETDPLCDATTYEPWSKITKGNRLTFLPFVKQGQYIFPWEKDYLSQPPLYDEKTLPSFNLSLVTIDNPRFANKTVSCNLGDVVTGRIYLKNGYGKQRTMGGDEVRVWITSPNGYAAAGDVQDLQNGTYHFSFRCLWLGFSKLNVAVPYPREFLRAVFQHSLAGITLYQLSRFQNGNLSESTLCSPIPNVPGRPCLCNITSFQRFPFYCGRPKDSRLTCADWRGSRITHAPKGTGVTPAEAALVEQASGSALKNAISQNIAVFVGNKTGNLPTLEPCNKLNASMTWNAKTPHGYFSPGYHWNSLQCRRPQMTSNFTKQCLRNTTVAFFGDSNSRHMYKILAPLASCKSIGVKRWPNITRCRNEEDDINISSCPHEYPLLYSVTYTSVPEYKDTPSQIDAMTSSRKYLIVIHYYLHYTYYHYSALVARIEAIYEALVRLLKRNPNVVVGIRGPHLSTRHNDRNHALGGDSLGPIYKKFLIEKFGSLDKRVFFLDGWEMTTAVGSEGFHPHRGVQTEIMLTLLSYYCP